MAHEEIEKAVLDVESGEKKSKKDLIKYIINISIVLVLTAFALFLTLNNNFFYVVSKLLETLSFDPANGNFKLLWLFAFFGVMGVSVLIRSLIMFCFSRLYSNKYRYRQALAVDCVGVFYNAVTPSSTGGQVMQAFTLKKQGIPISSAISMLVMTSIVYQIWLIVFGIISLIVKYDTITGINTFILSLPNGFVFPLPTWLLIIMGFALNVGYIGILLLMSYWKGFHNFIMGPIISLLNKIKIIKKPDVTRDNLRVQIENFKIEMRRIFSNIPFFILVSILFIIYQFLNFSLPYFVGMALGNEATSSNILDAVFLSNFHQMVSGLIPIPGGAGVSEYFFSNLFGLGSGANYADMSKNFANGAFAAFVKLDGVTLSIEEAYNSFLIGGINKLGQTYSIDIGKIQNIINNGTINDLLALINGNTGKYTISQINTVFYDGAFTQLISDSGITGYTNEELAKVLMQGGNLVYSGNYFYYVSPTVNCAIVDWSPTVEFPKSALLLWRTITFVVPLTISGVFSAFYRPGGKKSKTIREDQEAPNSLNVQTFVDLQKETIDDRIKQMDTMAETTRLNREEIKQKIKNFGKKITPKLKNRNKDTSSNQSEKQADEYDVIDTDTDIDETKEDNK